MAFRYRRLAHARLADQHRALAAQQGQQGRDVALRRHRHDGVAECGKGLEAREKRGEARLVGLVRDEHEAAALRLGGDDPAVDELLVDREVRCDDADHLGDVGRDQLLAERVGSVEQRAPRQHRLDRPAARHARDAHAVAAGQRRASAFEHAFERLAAVQQHRIVAPPAGRDEAGLQRCAIARLQLRCPPHRPRASTLAAQMQSFSVTPPALCVDQATTQRS